MRVLLKRLLQKLKLYNGKTLPGFTAENIKQLRREVKQGQGLLLRAV